MKKQVDVPKDQPVLVPVSKRPSLKELAEMDQSDTIKRVIGNENSTRVSAFNSSI